MLQKKKKKKEEEKKSLSDEPKPESPTKKIGSFVCSKPKKKK